MSASPSPRPALPKLLVLTDRTQAGDRSLVDVVKELVAGDPVLPGASAGDRQHQVWPIAGRIETRADRARVERVGGFGLVLREKDQARAERVALADQLRPLVRAAGGVFLVAGDPAIEADGVHLSATDEFPATRPQLVGRSCHGLGEVQAAEREGCDYVTLSPIFETPSKPGYGPALGLQGLRDVVDEVTVPIYALGGIDETIIDACFRAGASGVAIMGAAMRTPAFWSRSSASHLLDLDQNATGAEVGT